MVRHDLVVQRQRMITVAPYIPHARLLFDHERIDAQLTQPCRRNQTRMPSADDDHFGIAVGEGTTLLAILQPVPTERVHRIGVARGTEFVDLLLEAVQPLERGEQYPRRRTLVGEHQADERRDLPDIGFELEIALNNLLARPSGQRRRTARCGRANVAQPHRTERAGQSAGDFLTARKHLVLPGQGQKILPIALAGEKPCGPGCVTAFETDRERAQPLREHRCGIGLCESFNVVHQAIPSGSVAFARRPTV